ncbi:tRNA (adenosine(37)-N6)-dimethylallyltransferase MiaA [Oceanivirga salmonicida]|uniref:tRNA (adenosine(37)-N6)-dimethylallyltransferase MiaA n=1 Tax=Oceanivirga salmonicida TaxID=1769291 RepID=UPI0012E1EBC6|nr:tRNA (adenosine(37)-N6)-dimethylallyltransferase MiaA [Oceanivirga salmonicida]
MYNCLILAGPTAIGKTSLSIKLAQRLNMEIISADASQVYKELNIGTAKINKEQMQGIVHHLIDIVEPSEIYSVGRYYNDANKILNDNKNKQYIITGGTGLYIDSITDGLTDTPEVDFEKRKILENKSLTELVEILKEKKLDKDIDLKNKVRVIRKIEKGNIEYNNIKGNDRQFLKVFLTMDRTKLYERINKRVDIMLNNGLVEEAHNIYNKYGDIVTSIGYKELNKYFKNEIDLDTAIYLIKRNSRRYAKRQFTWFKNKGYEEFDIDKLNESQIEENIIRRMYAF